MQKVQRTHFQFKRSALKVESLYFWYEYWKLECLSKNNQMFKVEKNTLCLYDILYLTGFFLKLKTNVTICMCQS